MSDLYINIGSEKSCLFVEMSLFLLRKLEEQPLLNYAVEESLQCAKIGYFGIGIVAFAQLINMLNNKTPDCRHDVTHEFLRKVATKKSFEDVVAEFKRAASKRSAWELAKSNDPADYGIRLIQGWNQFVAERYQLT